MIYFVGAGPGDPELMTVKAVRLLGQADLVIYAGSLINPDVLDTVNPGARVVDSASMTLESVIEMMVGDYRRGRRVVRLHTGDPSLYGAIREQMDRLDQLRIPYRVVPGVSSFLAAAASLGVEYTVPEVAQTLIITRLEGRTPVPASEALGSLARHRTSLCLFLSAGMIERAAGELLQNYPPETPAAVVEKASWPDQRIVRGNLSEIAVLAQKAGITRTALILVGDFLESQGTRSLLYDPSFSHQYRQGEP